jgi:hypothetical protein
MPLIKIGIKGLTKFTTIPQILRKKCWVGASVLPQGRDEK